MLCFNWEPQWRYINPYLETYHFRQRSQQYAWLNPDQGGIEGLGGGPPAYVDSLLPALNFQERANHLPQYYTSTKVELFHQVPPFQCPSTPHSGDDLEENVELDEASSLLRVGWTSAGSKGPWWHSTRGESSGMFCRTPVSSWHSAPHQSRQPIAGTCTRHSPHRSGPQSQLAALEPSHPKIPNLSNCSRSQIHHSIFSCACAVITMYSSASTRMWTRWYRSRCRATVAIIK